MLTLRITDEDFARLPPAARQAIEVYAVDGRRVDRRDSSEYVFRLPAYRWEEVRALCGQLAQEE